MTPTLAQQFNLNVTPATISLTDTTPWVANGILLSQVAIIFQLSSPVGIFYSNTNYGSPDIAPATNPRTFTTPLPLDSHGKVVTGEYDLQMSAQVTAQSFSYTLLTATIATSTFTISGDVLNKVLNATGGTITIVGGANAGTYTIDPANCNFDSVNNITNIAVTTAVPSATVTGSTVTFTATQNYVITNTTTMCFVMPEVKMDIEGDCSTAILTAEDTTNYDAYLCTSNQPIIPTVISRVMTLVFPNNPTTGLPIALNIVTSGTTIQVVSPNLYTGTYQVSVVTQLEYIMPDGSVMVVTVSGQESYTLECDNNLCCAYQCMQNIFTNYLEAKSENPVEANTKWLPLLIKMMGLWMLTTQAHSCGDLDAYDKNLAALIILVKSNNCNCCPDNTSVPTQVIPMIPTGGGSTATTIVVAGWGITVTPVTVGSTTTYTVAIDATVLAAAITAAISNQKILSHLDSVQVALVNNQVIMYDSVSGLWKNILLTLSKISDVDMTGAATGYILTYTAGGKGQFLPVTFHNVLVNDIGNVGTPASNVETILKSYTIPSGTLVNNGDYVEIEAAFSLLGSFPNPNVVRFYFGAVPIVRKIKSYYKAIQVKYKIKISKINATTVLYELSSIEGQNPSILLDNVRGNYTESAANPLIVYFTGENGVSIGNNIIAEYLMIRINKI